MSAANFFSWGSITGPAWILLRFFFGFVEARNMGGCARLLWTVLFIGLAAVAWYSSAQQSAQQRAQQTTLNQINGNVDDVRRALKTNPGEPANKVLAAAAEKLLELDQTVKKQGQQLTTSNQKLAALENTERARESRMWRAPTLAEQQRWVSVLRPFPITFFFIAYVDRDSEPLWTSLMAVTRQAGWLRAPPINGGSGQGIWIRADAPSLGAANALAKLLNDSHYGPIKLLNSIRIPVPMVYKC